MKEALGSLMSNPLSINQDDIGQATIILSVPIQTLGGKKKTIRDIVYELTDKK